MIASDNFIGTIFTSNCSSVLTSTSCSKFANNKKFYYEVLDKYFKEFGIVFLMETYKKYAHFVVTFQIK